MITTIRSLAALALAAAVPTAAAAQTAPTPYYATALSIVVAASGGTCNVKSCFINLGKVPVGQRLTVTYVSARYKLTQASPTTGVGVYNANADNTGFTVFLPAPQTTGGLTYTAAAPVTAFVAGGATPAIYIIGPNISRTKGDVYVTINGYLSPQ